jgi:hypothetical protein
MTLTQEERISLIHKEATRQKQNKLQANYRKSKAKLRQETLQQVNLLVKCGIEANYALESAKEQQKYDNELTYLMRTSINDKQLKQLKL